MINFFTSTLTVPKIKDLVNTPTQRYDSMFNVISSASTSTGKNIMYNMADLLPSQSSTMTNNDEKTDMKNELKNFLKKQMNNVSSSTDISSLGSVYN